MILRNPSTAFSLLSLRIFDLGYVLNVAADADGVWWATLTAVDNPEFIVHRYGRGATQSNAAERARCWWRASTTASPTVSRSCG